MTSKKLFSSDAYQWCHFAANIWQKNKDVWNIYSRLFVSFKKSDSEDKCVDLTNKHPLNRLVWERPRNLQSTYNTISKGKTSCSLIFVVVSSDQLSKGKSISKLTGNLETDVYPALSKWFLLNSKEFGPLIPMYYLKTFLWQEKNGWGKRIYKYSNFGREYIEVKILCQFWIQLPFSEKKLHVFSFHFSPLFLKSLMMTKTWIMRMKKNLWIMDILFWMNWNFILPAKKKWIKLFNMLYLSTCYDK